MLKPPPIIEEMEKEFYALLTQDDKPDILASKVAEFLNMDIDKFRNMAYGKALPFALGEAGGKYGNGYLKINKLALYNWMYQRGMQL